MRFTRLLVATLFSMIAVASFASDTPDQQRAAIRSMVQEKLAKLYAAQPAAQSAVQNAVGYAVFSNTGVKILVAGSGTGKGMAVNNRSGADTFMKMLELQAGLGFGVKKFTVIFVFTTQDAFDHFVNSGWEFGGQASAAAKTSTSGGSFQGASSVGDGIYMYQMTDKGLAAEITVKSTKYRKDDDLNQ